jgi:hypothetical protein
MTAGAPRRDDSIMYEAETIRVGLILFPPRTCSHCGMVLPANVDYFKPDKRNPRALVPLFAECRRCRRDRDRDGDRRRQKARAEK